MKTVRQLFNDYVYSNTKIKIKKIDKLCIKLDVSSEDFWKYYISQKGNFSETEFLTNLLSYFYYFLNISIDKLLKENNIVSNFCIDYTSKPNLSIIDYDSFYNNVIKADTKIKQKLMENKIFNYLIKKTKIDFFTKKEIRKLKLDKIKQI